MDLLLLFEMQIRELGRWVGFNVRLQQRSGLLPTILDTSLRMFQETCHHNFGGDSSSALVQPEVQLEEELAGHCTYDGFYMQKKEDN